MKLARFAVAVVAATVLVPLTSTVATAAPAPPKNDRPSGARALTLGQTISEDTSNATTGSLDAQLNQVCGAPFTNASVWFTYTADQDGTVLLDMSQSDYSGGFMVFIGHPTISLFRGCGPTEIGMRVKTGKTYYVVAFSDTEVNGGNLKLSVNPGPPPPTFSATVDSDGKAYKDGDALVTGTFTCTNTEFGEMDGQLSQIWKRLKINGYFFKFIDSSVCDGAEHPWKRRVSSDNGLYAAGDATLYLSVIACGPLDCDGIEMDPQTVTLHGAKGKIAGTVSLRPAAHSTLTERGPLTWKTAQAH